MHLCVIFGLQRYHLVIELVLLKVEKLFQHLRAVFVTQLQELLKLSLWNDDGTFEVLVAQPDGLHQQLLIDGEPRVTLLLVGSTIQRLHLVEPSAVATPSDGAAVGCLLTTCFKDEIDQQFIRFQVHHVVVAVVTRQVQPVGTTVKGEGDRLEDGGLTAAHHAEDAEQAGTGKTGEVDGLLRLVGVESLQRELYGYHASSAIISLNNCMSSSLASCPFTCWK